MGDDDHAWPSLLLAKHERAHREHVHQHQHQHHLFHRAPQTGATVTAVQSVVTQVTATVSVVQQIDVDPNGSTFAIQTILADSTYRGWGGTPTTKPNALPTTSASPAIASSSSSASSTIAGGSPQVSASQSLNSSTSTAVPSTSSFSSLIASSNSTTLISSSASSLTPNFSNSSISTTSSSSSSTFLSTSSSSSEASSTSTSSTSSLYSPSSSVVATITGGGIPGGTAASTGTAPTTTAGTGNGTSSNASNTPSTPVVVGGVVGSIAGVAILVFLLLAFIRWKKRHQSMLSLGSGNEAAGAVTSREAPPPSQPSGGMTERRSLAFVPAALTNLGGFKRTSRQTDRTVSSTAESERGFYRVSGRKIPSVLQSGGDGYGGGIAEPNTLSGSSFYRDSQGFYGGPGSPTSAIAGPSTRPESGVPVMRPSPARTPVTQQGPFSAATPEPLTPPRRPDVLGRSHPSQDGSHTSSRFKEEV
ncbi:hypothetical protein EG329_002661 [Mollisiaceae sp. DMI_Dod_QoI]|nr:hypothetical protein EG329_002661 [Helotiales sp. DMI_Dod_QoI]